MKYKIIEQKADCVLLYKPVGNSAKYIVKDIEGDIIFMGYDDLELAKREFDSYDLEEVRRTKKEEFIKWLNEHAEA
jgi:hypothetical protein